MSVISPETKLNFTLPGQECEEGHLCAMQQCTVDVLLLYCNMLIFVISILLEEMQVFFFFGGLMFFVFFEKSSI